MARLVTAAVYYDLSEAMAAKAFIEAQGLLVFLFDAQLASMNWLYMVAIQGVRLQVLESELDDTRALLATRTSDLREGAVEACPACGSGNISRPCSRLILALFLLLGIGSFVLPTKRRVCQMCGHNWRAAKSGRSSPAEAKAE